MEYHLPPEQAISHLQPEIWKKVNRIHLRKVLSEFAHERLIEPRLIRTRDGWGEYSLEPGDAPVEYRFRARLLSLDHWYIQAGSIQKRVNGQAALPDSTGFIIEFKDILGIDAGVLPAYLEEISSTLSGSAYVHAQAGPDSAALVNAGYQDIEHAMIAGHPCFVANNGRIGFDACDYRNYAPEAASPLSLVWVAGHRDRTEFTSIAAVSYEKLIAREVGDAVLASFKQVLAEKGRDPRSYVFFPVHPWQWFNKLAHVFAPDIAGGYLVCLGYSPDKYLPQQSIRTFYNVSDPGKHYVKTALSILNMGFMRGLSPYFMRTTPPVNEWVGGIVERDSFLQEKKFSILKEVATVGYTNRYYEKALEGSDSAYKKMLASLWRESPADRLGHGERLMTMAALLHTDMHGKALLPELIKASGLEITTWIRQYLDCYLSPLLHCFYYYDMRFMPHGENVILVLQDHVPVRVILKDTGEEVAVINPGHPLPEAVNRIAIQAPGELKILSIFTQIFDCFLRFVSQVLVEHCDYPEKRFWAEAAACISAYQQRYPELEEKYRQCDLFMPAIPKTCLNRLQLRNNRKMIDNADPFKGQQFAGTLKNPLAEFRPSLVKSDEL